MLFFFTNAAKFPQICKSVLVVPNFFDTNLLNNVRDEISGRVNSSNVCCSQFCSSFYFHYEIVHIPYLIIMCSRDYLKHSTIFIKTKSVPRRSSNIESAKINSFRTLFSNCQKRLENTRHCSYVFLVSLFTLTYSLSKIRHASTGPRVL